ncbi:MAG: T9SS type A sorting domain-containing protein [Bacteroidetes bacterium]|nr:T9SS type A sorting domain-containing protein [Bacteroidota bacterium]
MKKIFTLSLIAIFCKSFSQTLVVPTVFHVIYNSAGQNVSDPTILQQLQTLNYDYSDTTCANTYTPAANTNIQFMLAQQDPNGNPTNGIIHKQTTAVSFTSDNKVMSSATGGDDIWDRDSYLNIYVCNLAGGLIGYSQFPCATASTDALVIHYCTVNGTCPPYNLGKTASSELGHWFGLVYTVGNACAIDVDGIPDTYTSDGSCSSSMDTCSGLTQVALCTNYMTYADDALKCFFTAGQKAVMWNAINSCRASLKTSQGGNPPAGVNNYGSQKSFSVSPNPFSTSTTLQTNTPLHNATLTVYNCYGQEVTQSVIPSGARNLTITRDGLPSGIYFYKVTEDKGQGASEAIATGKLVITDK